jgi:hypothetical protein
MCGRVKLETDVSEIKIAVDVDHGAQTRCGLANSSDVDAAAPTDDEISRARAEAAGFDQRPMHRL